MTKICLTDRQRNVALARRSLPPELSAGVWENAGVLGARAFLLLTKHFKNCVRLSLPISLSLGRHRGIDIQLTGWHIQFCTLGCGGTLLVSKT